jgi:hypothetical protein
METPGGGGGATFGDRNVEPARHPVDAVASHAVVIGQEAPNPDAGGLLVVDDADAPAGQVFGTGDLVGADIDVGMTKGPRQEHRQADIAIAAVVRGGDVAAQRHLGDVEAWSRRTSRRSPGAGGSGRPGRSLRPTTRPSSKASMRSENAQARVRTRLVGHPAQASSTMVFFSRPTPAISTSTTSPAFIHTGGSRLAPTPPGVPVRIRSPGDSGVKPTGRR